ncbi:MAG: hypothetical protein AB8U66_02765 [Rickettsiales endosymbiont of Dermacentor nuttalli]
MKCVCAQETTVVYLQISQIVGTYSFAVLRQVYQIVSNLYVEDDNQNIENFHYIGNTTGEDYASDNTPTLFSIDSNIGFVVQIVIKNAYEALMLDVLPSKIILGTGMQGSALVFIGSTVGYIIGDLIKGIESIYIQSKRYLGAAIGGAIKYMIASLSDDIGVKEIILGAINSIGYEFMLEIDLNEFSYTMLAAFLEGEEQILCNLFEHNADLYGDILRSIDISLLTTAISYFVYDTTVDYLTGVVANYALA